MKECIICEKKFENEHFEICETCRDFLISKYKGDIEKELDRFRDSKEYLDDWRSQKDEKEGES